MVRKGKELSKEMKENIVALNLGWYNQARIAEMFKIIRSTVSRVLHKYKSSENKSRSGRPRLADQKGDRQLFRLLKRNRRESLLDLTNAFNRVTPVKVSKRTVQRRLHSSGYKNRKIRKAITISEVNRKRRVVCCRGNRFLNRDFWNKVIFSDETQVVIGKNKAVHVWRKSTEKWRPECLNVLKGPTNVSCMFWGCITRDGVGTLVPVEGNINSDKYIEYLDNNLWPVIAKVFGANPYIFQDDNATPHRSLRTSAWKTENNINTMDWPAQSPDLNIIEIIWLTIKIKLCKVVNDINTRADLIAAVTKIWEKLPQVYIKSLYSSIPRRLRHVILSKGYITKY